MAVRNENERPANKSGPGQEVDPPVGTGRMKLGVDCWQTSVKPMNFWNFRIVGGDPRAAYGVFYP